MRAYVILNPNSGKRRSKRVCQAIHHVFPRSGVTYDIHYTKKAEPVNMVVHRACEQGCDMVVASGGDGTISQTASGLIHHREIPLGIIPSGTANLLARELGIPMEFEAACRLIAETSTATAIDVMQRGEHFHLGHVSLGLYARIAENTNMKLKQRIGRFAYLQNLVTELRRRRKWQFTLELDGTQHQYRASTIMLSNISAYGLEPLRWGRHIRPNDGVIDVCVVRAFTVGEILQLFWHAFRGQHDKTSYMKYLEAKQHITVRTPGERVPVRGDGELVGYSEVEMNVLPKALQVCMP